MFKQILTFYIVIGFTISINAQEYLKVDGSNSMIGTLKGKSAMFKGIVESNNNDAGFKITRPASNGSFWISNSDGTLGTWFSQTKELNTVIDNDNSKHIQFRDGGNGNSVRMDFDILTSEMAIGGLKESGYTLKAYGKLKVTDLLATRKILIEDPNSISDYNSLWQSGFYEGYNKANAPETNAWFWGINMGHSSNREDYKY